MLSEFEIALVQNSDLEQTAQMLMHQADVRRDEQRQVINHDLRFAKLIRQALLEPSGSGMYCIAKAYLKQFQKRHNPHGDILAHQLMKEAGDNQPQKGRGNDNYESDNARTGKTTGIESAFSGSTGSEECVYPAVQENTQGPCEGVE